MESNGLSRKEAGRGNDSLNRLCSALSSPLLLMYIYWLYYILTGVRNADCEISNPCSKSSSYKAVQA